MVEYALIVGMVAIIVMTFAYAFGPAVWDAVLTREEVADNGRAGVSMTIYRE